MYFCISEEEGKVRQVLFLLLQPGIPNFTPLPTKPVNLPLQYLMF